MSTLRAAATSLGRLYIITDRRAAAAAGGLVNAVAALLAAIPPGSALLQVREKDLEAAELIALVRRLRALARPHRVPVLVNDRIDVALAAGADGVHLPETSFSVAEARQLLRAGGGPALVGVSTHGAAAAGRAAAAGADLVVCGPMQATPSKAAYGPPLGPAAIAEAAQQAGPTPLYAVGGIATAADAHLARNAGAHGVAAIHALMSQPHTAAALLAAITPDQRS